MNRFRGRYNYTVDAKGRINVPSKFRRALSPDADETFVVVRAPDDCLRAYPRDSWDRYEERLRSRPESPGTVKVQRLIYSTLSESHLDAQGRITLSSNQLEIAGIVKDVILIGQLDYIEIWAPEKFAQYTGPEDDFNTVFYQSVQTEMRGQ